MRIKDNQNHLEIDIEAVITSYNQGDMLLEAVNSLCQQTLLPKRIIIVDDGSTDRYSLEVLNDLQNNIDLPVPITICYQENQGV
ncbi:MAG: glycosyltransferase [Beduini sp.]